MKTTIDQPMPIRSRFAPVMFASASEHLLSPGSVAALHSSPNSANACPPSNASTKSTAYSGNTAMNASTAIARPAEMSSCAASAAHDRMNAAPTIASPYRTASSQFSVWMSAIRRTSPGTVAATARTMPRPCRAG